MLWVKIGTHIIDHPRFITLGTPARDLWLWGMLYSGRHELDGDLPMASVLTSAWGRGGRANVKLAQSLVTAGLWERIESGYRICRWSEQGNATKAEIAAGREATKARVSRHRNGVTNGVSNAIVPTSTSTSLSVSVSSGYGSQIASGPPDWWQSTLDTIQMATGEALPAAEAWLRYDGHRAGKGIAPNTRDAQYWLTTVMVPERRKARDDAHHREKRDADFDRNRRNAKDPPPMPPVSREQARADAKRFAAAILGRKVGT